VPVAPLFAVFRSSAPHSSVPRPPSFRTTSKTPKITAPPSESTGHPERHGEIVRHSFYFSVLFTFLCLCSGDHHIQSLKARLGSLTMGPNLTSLTPKTRSELAPTLKRPRANEPISEPRAARRRRLPTSTPVPDDSAPNADDDDATETDTDGPARPYHPTVRTIKGQSFTTIGIERSHSSPPDTPHRTSKISAWKKANGLRRERTAGEIGSGSSVAGPSRPKALIMTKEEREAHFKELRSKPHTEYKKEYAAYKGHGRYGQRPAGYGILSGCSALWEHCVDY
jgi:hypothetical protein